MRYPHYAYRTEKTYYDWILRYIKFDELVKSRKTPFFVIPAKAGIQFFQLVTEFLDSGFHRSDNFLRNHQISWRKNPPKEYRQK